MRWLGLAMLIILLGALPAHGQSSCDALSDEQRVVQEPADQTEALLLTENQCESVQHKELRLRLFEIPQDDEDPMALSLSAKSGTGMVRFKIPFSF